MTAVQTPPVAQQTISPQSQELVDSLRMDQRRERRRRVWWGILTPVVLLAVWELLTRSGVWDYRFFPAPTMILADTWDHLVDVESRTELGMHMLASGQRLMIGFVLGTLFGLTGGLLMGLVPWVRYSFEAIVSATYPLPKLALYPLMIILFGIGGTSMTALVVLGVFFMVCINTLSGVAYSPVIYREVAKSFQVPSRTKLARITIPAALPSVLGGLKLGFGQALIIVVSTEFVGGQEGVGYMIWNSWQVLDVSLMFIGLAIVGLIGWLGSSLLTRLARVLVPWQTDD